MNYWYTLLIGFVACNLPPSIASKLSSNFGPSGSSYRAAYSWLGYQIGAFVDLNADRNTDIILINKEGTELSVVIAPEKKVSLRIFQSPEDANKLPDPVPLLSPGFTHPIRGIVASDFNGDSIVDILLLESSSPSGPFDTYISYGRIQSDKTYFGEPVKIDTFVTQPLVCDINSDLVSDLYGETLDGKRMVVIGGANITTLSAAYTGPKWSSSSYSAFGDIDGNAIPDIVILVEDGGEYKLQVFLRTPSTVSKLPSETDAILIDFPKGSVILPHNSNMGLFLLSDFDGDGGVDLMVPVCAASSCKTSSELYVYSFKKQHWIITEVEWTPSGIPEAKDYTWSLMNTPNLASGLSVGQLVGPVIGDINLDGLPDVGIGLTYWGPSGTEQQNYPAVLLNKGSINSGGKLKFEAFLFPGANHSLVRQVAFFDHGEKGSLDTFIVSLDAHSQPTTKLFVQSTSNEYYFLKVMVLNGLCRSPSTCTGNRLPYGLQVPGIRTSYDTDAADGRRQQSTALLGTQSCCGALQLPYWIFGLGPFANFVEQVFVSIASDATHQRIHTIRGLVPNSEVFINPYPHNHPGSWSTKLFLQPLYNMKVVYVAVALVSICILLIIVISILQWLEYREDKSEKQKEAQRFHFDAL